jgi:hypothetical protein
VEGIEEKDFFTFYGELMCALSKPVDVIDLSITSRFSELVNLEVCRFMPDYRLRIDAKD